MFNMYRYIFIFVTGMPTVEEVCSSFGLTDVEIPYTDADYENLTTYKLFQQHVRPMIVKENPKVIVVQNLTKLNLHYYNLMTNNKIQI